MPTEEEAEARSIGVVARRVSIVIPPIGATAMVMTAVPPATAVAIVDGFYRITIVNPNILEAGCWRRRCGSGEHADREGGRGKRQGPSEHVSSFLFWPGVIQVAPEHVTRPLGS
jgi:hypothetical protein